MVFCSWNFTSTSLVCSNFFPNFFVLLSWPIMTLAWWICLWLLFVHPKTSSEVSDRKWGKSGNQHRKSVPRYIRQTLLSKNQFPIYAYTAQLNISTSYRLTEWYASVLGWQISDDDCLDSLIVTENLLSHSPHVSIPYDYIAKIPPRPPDPKLGWLQKYFWLWKKFGR